MGRVTRTRTARDATSPATTREPGGHASPPVAAVAPAAGAADPGRPAPAGPAPAAASRTARTRPVRLLLVDADRRVRAGLASLLELSPEVEIVATAGDVRGALAACTAASPEVVVVDPRLPEAPEGIAFIRAVRERWPLVRVVALAWSGRLARALGDDPGVTVVPKTDAGIDLGERVVSLVVERDRAPDRPGRAPVSGATGARVAVDAAGPHRPLGRMMMTATKMTA